jgi:hypothetical protein
VRRASLPIEGQSTVDDGSFSEPLTILAQDLFGSFSVKIMISHLVMRLKQLTRLEQSVDVLGHFDLARMRTGCLVDETRVEAHSQADYQMVLSPRSSSDEPN